MIRKGTLLYFIIILSIISSFANSYECIFAKDYGGVFVNLGTLNSSMDFVQGCGADIGAFTYTFNNSISVYSNMFNLNQAPNGIIFNDNASFTCYNSLFVANNIENSSITGSNKS